MTDLRPGSAAGAASCAFAAGCRQDPPPGSCRSTSGVAAPCCCTRTIASHAAYQPPPTAARYFVGVADSSFVALVTYFVVGGTGSARGCKVSRQRDERLYRPRWSPRWCSRCCWKGRFHSMTAAAQRIRPAASHERRRLSRRSELCGLPGRATRALHATGRCATVSSSDIQFHERSVQHLWTRVTVLVEHPRLWSAGRFSGRGDCRTA
jgi:hypothetical protein